MAEHMGGKRKMPMRKHMRRIGRSGDKTHKVMHEYKMGTLRSSSGTKVRSRKQAVAIALSEARRAGADIPKKRPRGSGPFADADIRRGFRVLRG